jgi:hypothetical protein
MTRSRAHDLDRSLDVGIARDHPRARIEGAADCAGEQVRVRMHESTGGRSVQQTAAAQCVDQGGAAAIGG